MPKNEEVWVHTPKNKYYVCIDGVFVSLPYFSARITNPFKLYDYLKDIFTFSEVTCSCVGVVSGKNGWLCLHSYWIQYTKMWAKVMIKDFEDDIQKCRKELEAIY